MMNVSMLAQPAGELALWERPGFEPPIVLCHATGFHARCWDQVITCIYERRALALDMRGHGRSVLPHPKSWRDFGEDVAQLCRGLSLRGAIGVGHSMGGHAVALAAALAPGAFSALVLIDPVIQPEARYQSGARSPHFARKRRNHWKSAAEMFDSFAQRQPFAAWNRAVLRDYCEHGLRPAPDGEGFVLACPPAVEAWIYEHSTAVDANIYADIEKVRVPVLVVRSAREFVEDPAIDMGASPTARDLATRFACGSDLRAGWSHFIPMEAPEFTAGLIAAVAARCGN
jgi:lipase